MAEDVTHHLPQVLLSIPEFPLEFFDTLHHRLMVLGLHFMETVHPCPEPIQDASACKHLRPFEGS